MKNKIHKHPKANTKGFVQNPENINRKGRPKRLFTQHTEDLKALGYEVPSKNEYYDLIGLLLVMTEDDLNEFESDKDRPLWIRYTITDFKDDKKRQSLMSDLRDWLFGKAGQSHEIIETKPLAENNTFSDLNLEQLEAIENIINGKPIVENDVFCMLTLDQRTRIKAIKDEEVKWTY